MIILYDNGILLKFIIITLNFTQHWVTSCNGSDKKKKKKRSSAEPKTPEFLLAHDPQRAAKGWDATELDPDLQPPQNDLQRTKNREKRRGIEKSNETPARPNYTKSTSKPPFYATKVIPKPFRHIRGRFRRILYVEHRRQGRRNVEFLNFSRSGSVRPLQTRSIPKTGLGGRRDSGTEEKGGKKDIETTLTRREKSHQKNVQAIGCRRQSPTRGPDPATQTEPNHLRSAQYSTTPAAQSLQRKMP